MTLVVKAQRLARSASYPFVVLADKVPPSRPPPALGPHILTVVCCWISTSFLASHQSLSPRGTSASCEPFDNAFDRFRRCRSAVCRAITPPLSISSTEPPGLHLPDQAPILRLSVKRFPRTRRPISPPQLSPCGSLIDPIGPDTHISPYPALCAEVTHAPVRLAEQSLLTAAFLHQDSRHFRSTRAEKWNQATSAFGRPDACASSFLRHHCHPYRVEPRFRFSRG